MKQGKMDDAVAIVMQTKTKDQSAVVWNLVIDAYAKSGRLSRALRAYTEMRRRGFKPTQMTFTALLKACALSDSESSMDIAKELFDSMSSHGVEPSIININMLLGVYQRKGGAEAMLECFNGLPAEGKTAPTLVTYTMVVSALRRELLTQLSSLRDKPATEPHAGEPLSQYDARRIALIKQNTRQTFSAMMGVWSSFAEDASHRLSALPEDTPMLLVDSRFVNILLKSCHSVYAENRALGRQGFRILEQVYGLDNGFGSKPAAPPKAAGVAPLAARLRAAVASEPGSSALIDSDTVDLALELCARDEEHMKAIRFWRSLQDSFRAELQPSKSNYLRYLDTLHARLVQYELAPK
ncbi:hypothetical protein GQ54DRAFT_312315 [Martensiomyces pterosporus]|nr:hypothetical protein GQ54DRAFT_312315 [Martensiomyces pterosporus]